MSIGENIHRVDGEPKVRGKTKYIADLKIPGLLHGAVIRAPIASGRLKRLAFDPAFDWSSVSVVTPRDIPGSNLIRMIQDDMPCLVEERINYLGEPVGLICASDPATARRAADCVTVETDSLPGLFGIEKIVETYRRAPEELVVFHHCQINKGDVARALRESDLVVEGEYFTGPQEHAYLEPQGAVAIPLDHGGTRILGSLQCPYYVRPAVAKVLGVPDELVVVEQTAMGGAFGGKEDFPSLLASWAALLARKSNRPVRMIFERSEDIAFTTKRHAAWIRHRTAVGRDGSLVGMEAQILLDGGAYVTLSPVVLSRAILHACGVYRCPNVGLNARAVKSNVPPSGALRGFGAPQVLFGLESHMDEIASRLDMSPLEIRQRNVLRTGDTLATGQVLSESVGGELCLETVADESGYVERRRELKEQSRRKDAVVKKGIGLAALLHGASFTGSGERTLRSRAALRLRADGTVEILAASTEMGQGVLTALSQIVAEALSLPMDQIRYRLPDTSYVPNSGPTVASRCTMIVGRILEGCARELVSRIETALRSGAAREGAGFRASDGARVSWLEAAARACAGGPLTVEQEYDFPPDQLFDEQTCIGSPYPVYSWGAVAAEVEVDTRTYEVAPRRLWLAYEIGRAVNPMSARGQSEGGSIQALGWGLLERLDNQAGRYVQDRLQTYIIPTSSDIPDIRTRILELPYSRGPGGAKGIGELPMNGVAAAVRNAVRHAIGVGVNSLPVTPEKIFAALHAEAAR